MGAGSGGLCCCCILIICRFVSSGKFNLDSRLAARDVGSVGGSREDGGRGVSSVAEVVDALDDVGSDSERTGRLAGVNVVSRSSDTRADSS